MTGTWVNAGAIPLNRLRYGLPVRNPIESILEKKSAA
jgi:hypothetical protein